MMQLSDDSIRKACRQRAHLRERYAQTRDLHRLHTAVVGVVRLETTQQRVALTLDSLISLVDREVVFSNEGAIVPGLTYILSELLGLITRKKPNDDNRGEKNQSRPDSEAPPDVFPIAYYLSQCIHFCMIVMALRPLHDYFGAKIRKISVKAEKKY